MMRLFLMIALAWCCPAMLNAQTNNSSNLDSIVAVGHPPLEPAPITSNTKLWKHSSKLLVPTGMFGFGVLANHNSALQNFNIKIRDGVMAGSNSMISPKVEDILQYCPAYSVFALNAVGLKSRSNFIDRLAIYGISNTLMSHTVSKLKTVSSKLRPDGQDRRSFPSGHTATAFSAAEFMRLEYKNASPVYGIMGYAMAATTGALRIYHNKHWFSDVIAGAGIGILSTDFSYWIYPKLKSVVQKTMGIKQKGKLSVGPSYQDGRAGFSLVYNPGKEH